MSLSEYKEVLSSLIKSNTDIFIKILYPLKSTYSLPFSSSCKLPFSLNLCDILLVIFLIINFYNKTGSCKSPKCSLRECYISKALISIYILIILSFNSIFNIAYFNHYHKFLMFPSKHISNLFYNVCF